LWWKYWGGVAGAEDDEEERGESVNDEGWCDECGDAERVVTKEVEIGGTVGAAAKECGVEKTPGALS
jgi:hypothetical protein